MTNYPNAKAPRLAALLKRIGWTLIRWADRLDGSP